MHRATRKAVTWTEPARPVGSHRVRRACVLAAVWLAVLLAPRPARAAPPCGAAPGLAVGMDQGVFLPRSYAFDATVLPGVDEGPFRLAASAGAAFANPDWAFSAGGRFSVVVWAPATPSTGLRLATDWNYLTLKSWRGTGGFVVDLDSVRVGARAGYDSFHRSAVILTSIEFDIPTVVSFLPLLWKGG